MVINKERIDKAAVSGRFSQAALNYQQNAPIQHRMADVLSDFAYQQYLNLKKKMNILDIGCGTGFATKAILKRFPNASITAVDIAPGMITEMRNQFQNQNIRFICGDIEGMDLIEKFDLIISNAAFQWFSQPEATLSKITGWLNEEGMLCFSTFGDQTFREFQHSYRTAAENLNIRDFDIPGLRLISGTELESICRRAVNDFSWQVLWNEDLYHSYFPTSRECLLSVKKIGAGKLNPSSAPYRLPLLMEALRIYDGYYRQAGSVIMTYHVLYCLLGKNKGGPLC